MDINTLIIVIGFGAVYLFLKNFLSLYLEEKGKNLATKEDVQVITKKTEEIKIDFQKELDEYTRNSNFRLDYSYKRYSELYSKLYTMISQSEYFRYYYKKYHSSQSDYKEITFQEFPFFEISKKEEKQKINFFTGEILEKREITIQDTITVFDKRGISELIIKNSSLASRKLLKVAVAYRYANDHYGGSKRQVSEKIDLEAFNNEEIRLLQEMIMIIIQDFNMLARDLKLDYNQSELENGKYNNTDFDSKEF